jgi:hypothetical protein
MIVDGWWYEGDRVGQSRELKINSISLQFVHGVSVFGVLSYSSRPGKNHSGEITEGFIAVLFEERVADPSENLWDDLSKVRKTRYQTRV